MCIIATHILHYCMILLNLCVSFFFYQLYCLFSEGGSKKDKKELQEKRNLQECQVGLEDPENLGVPVGRKAVKGTLQNT